MDDDLTCKFFSPHFSATILRLVTSSSPFSNRKVFLRLDRFLNRVLYKNDSLVQDVISRVLRNQRETKQTFSKMKFVILVSQANFRVNFRANFLHFLGLVGVSGCRGLRVIGPS